MIGFVTKYDKVGFGGALDTLARRAGLDARKLMEERARIVPQPAVEALTPAGAPSAAILARVVDHYHRTFCARADAQEYLKARGLTDADLLRAHRIGYAEGRAAARHRALPELRSRPGPGPRLVPVAVVP